MIQEFYISKKIVPTTAKILPVMRKKINWQWSETTLREIIRQMGFTWKKSQNKWVILVERQDILNWRSRYITTISRMRHDGKRIFYLESWVNSNMTFNRCWQKKGDVQGIMATSNASNRLIIVHIGSEKSFLAGGLLIYKARAVTRDYHGQINVENFKKWLSSQVLPNLPPGSVVVMDNTPYHGKQVDKVPSKYSVKADMTGWLERPDVAASSSVQKSTLIE
jgi:hypothetical protein